MILSRPDLRAEYEAGRLKIEPAPDENQWGEASIDLRLGFDFTKLEAVDGVVFSVASGLGAIGKMNPYSRRKLAPTDAMGKPEKLELNPGEFILALTHEKVTIPPHLIGLVEGRSTYARVGLSMHQTAPWIQPGWGGQITLEIRNSGPLVIALQPLLDRPCQLTLFQLSKELAAGEKYGGQDGGRYQGQKAALPGQD